MEALSFSFIIPVYNRPDEIQELLESFLHMDGHENCEIVIIEDGSTKPCQDVLSAFSSRLNISYYMKTNSGPGDSRNYGMRKAKGNYFIVLDSDVLLPKNYFQRVRSFLKKSFVHCFGGPDAAHSSFSNLQKAINFAMTSFITTGGIRGAKRQLQNFQPRSFNMGLSKQAFEVSGGFGRIHPGEDPDLALRLNKLGFKTALIEDAYVYHKRRISWSKYFIQVYKFGMVRPIITVWHPSSKSPLYWLPTLFAIGLVGAVGLLIFNVYWPLIVYTFYFFVAFVVALLNSKSIVVSFQSILAILIQFSGYGLGYMRSYISLNVFRKKPETAFPDLFFN